MFDELSVNWYVTVVVPVKKNAPGACVLCCRLVCPQSSLPDGSDHVTVVPPVPSNTVFIMSLDIPMHIGGVVSTETQ